MKASQAYISLQNKKNKSTLNYPTLVEQLQFRKPNKVLHPQESRCNCWFPEERRWHKKCCNTQPHCDTAFLNTIYLMLHK